MVVYQQAACFDLALGLVVVLSLDAEDGIPEGQVLVVGVDVFDPFPGLVPPAQVDGGVDCQVGDILALAFVLSDKFAAALEHEFPIAHLIDALDLGHNILIVVARLIVLLERLVVMLQLLMPTYLRLDLVLFGYLQKPRCRLWLPKQGVYLDEYLHLSLGIELEQLLAEIQGLCVGEGILRGLRQEFRLELREIVLAPHELSQVEDRLTHVQRRRWVRVENSLNVVEHLVALLAL